MLNEKQNAEYYNSRLLSRKQVRDRLSPAITNSTIPPPKSFTNLNTNTHLNTNAQATVEAPLNQTTRDNSQSRFFRRYLSFPSWNACIHKHLWRIKLTWIIFGTCHNAYWELLSFRQVLPQQRSCKVLSTATEALARWTANESQAHAVGDNTQLRLSINWNTNVQATS